MAAALGGALREVVYAAREAADGLGVEAREGRESLLGGRAGLAAALGLEALAEVLAGLLRGAAAARAACTEKKHEDEQRDQAIHRAPQRDRNYS